MIEPESHVRADYGRYTTPDPHSVEDETAALIVALIGALKPARVVELGTHRGFLAERIGTALTEQGGVLWTFERDADLHEEAIHRCHGLPVRCMFGDVAEIDPGPYAPYGLLIVDADPRHRARDYERWGTGLESWGLAVIHDSLKDDRVETAVAALPGGKVWLRTPRGVTLVQR